MQRRMVHSRYADMQHRLRCRSLAYTCVVIAASIPAMAVAASAAGSAPQTVLTASAPAAAGTQTQLQLKGPFTLRYAVTHRNRRPEYNSDYQITWSSRDGKLYYQRKTAKGECETDVYDGHSTYSLSLQNDVSFPKAENGQVAIFPGIRVGQAGYGTGETVEAMPGVGLPYLPLIVHGDPSSVAANPGVHYMQGEVSGENYSFTSPPILSEKARFSFSGSQLNKIEFPFGGYWKFQDQRPFQGVMLAGEIKAVSLTLTGDAIVENQGQIDGITTYHLLKADKEPLPAWEFDYGTWLKPNISVHDYRKAGLTMISWQPNRGTVEAQLAQAPKIEEISQTPTTPIKIAIGIAAALIVAGAARLRAIIRQKRKTGATA